MNRFARSSILKRTILQQSKRNNHDASKPFPPPQPTRPIDMLNDASDSNINDLDPLKDSVMSTALDSVTDETVSTKEKAYRRSHHFDTYDLAMHLENHGFTRGQSETIMKGIKFRLRQSTASVKQQLLFTSDLENESYLFKAALSELRTEVQVMRRNDMQMLQTELSTLTREVESLEQRLSESVADMKNEIQMDMNNRKNETREEQKAMDMKIQEINNKFTIQLGDIRTEIEAVRWETIWKGMTGVLLAGLTIASIGYLLNRLSAKKAEFLRAEADRKKKLKQEEANRAGTADMEVIF